jgi:cytochrome P450
MIRTPIVSIDLEAFERNPYPLYRRLQAECPVVWVKELSMWLVTRYATVQRILTDSERFRTGTSASLIFDTFGHQMLTVEGVQHDRYRNAFRRAFALPDIEANAENSIRESVDHLLESFPRNAVELRAALASRLPILTVLRLFNIDPAREQQVRALYDVFEKALSNFSWDPSVRRKAATAVEELHSIFHEKLRDGSSPLQGLFDQLASLEPTERLSDEEAMRNASIIFFGAISTAEALILNCVYALLHHPPVFARAMKDPEVLRRIIEETMRWQSPVQSATRHIHCDTNLDGVHLQGGDTVSCMLGAANHDPAVFPDAERFDIDRPNLRRHLGFAAGPHFCLGLHLARLEVRVVLECLLTRLRELRLDSGRPAEIVGSEFRRPRALWVTYASTS